MATYTNSQLADIFNKIADLLEIKGEVIYKILAYRRVAESLNGQTREASEYWKEGKLEDIPGVGKAIAEKIDELFTTGKLEFLDKLEAEVPATLVDLLQVPSLGPKKVALFWKELGITNLEQLSAAAREGKLHGLPGIGEKTEATLIAGIEALSCRSTRIPLGQAWPFAQRLLAFLREIPGVEAVEMAGSLRRMRSTVGDLDILAAAKDTKPVMAAFTERPDVVRVLGKGDTKSSVEFGHGLRAQLWVLPPERFGTALQYATGSKDHNVRLREIALKKKLSLSEHALTRPDGTEILCATEQEVYQTLGLPWIPPELREDRGEIQAALKGKLPDLIELQDIQAELHAHTVWSDGKLNVRDLADVAISRGFKVLAITDHSPSLGVAGGLKAEDLIEQRRDIDTVQKELGDRLLLLQGTEMEIRADGGLDYPDEVLEKLDIVIASLHVGLRQPREKVTERLINAIRNPHVDIIGHPTGRLFPDREGADLDMEAVLRAAAEHKTALEINAHTARLDLDDVNARRAQELGIQLCINTDAHSQSDFDMLPFGIATARRGWIGPKTVLNTWKTADLLDWLKQRKMPK